MVEWRRTRQELSKMELPPTDPYQNWSADNDHASASSRAVTSRTTNRDSLFLSAALSIAGDAPVQVRVRNLSAGGLMVEFGAPLAPGTAVTIELRGIGKVDGEVAWSAEGRIGVALLRQIDPKKARMPVGKSR